MMNDIPEMKDIAKPGGPPGDEFCKVKDVAKT